MQQPIYTVQYDESGENSLERLGIVNALLTHQTAMTYDGASSGCSSCSLNAGPGNGEQPTSISYPTFEKKFGYDALGRKVGEKDVLSTSEEYLTTYQYDESGNLVSKTDKQGNTTTYQYDSLNRLSKVIDPLGGETSYAYDDRDNLLSLADATGNTTLFEYDSANRLVKETRPLGQVTTYGYDEAGNLSEKIDSRGQKIEYGYDDANRLAETRYFAASDLVTPVKTVTFTYDTSSNLTGYADGTTSATYSYDALNRKTGETVNYGSFSLSQSYTYHANGLKASYTGPDNNTYSYSYDANNQLAAVDIPGQGMISYNSYTWTRPDAVTLPGGSRKEYGYDPLMRVKDITGKDRVGQTGQSYQYNYDGMDNILQKSTEHGGYNYTYDDLYRLTDADNPLQTDESYTYDGVGNRLTNTDYTDWTYNGNNELLGFNSVSYQYDDNGNMVSKTVGVVVLNFIYNEENRLVKVETDQGVVIAEYYYDPFGRRLWKEVSGVRTYFLYSDEGLVGEYDAAGNEIKTYGWQPNSIWSTDPLFMKQGGAYYYYRNDHLGTPMQMTDSDGLVVWEAKYDAFGKAVVEAGSTITNNLRFPGQYYDSETGLHYNWWRYYSPETGRYLRTDPLGFGGDFNLYGYVGDPINDADPMGLCPNNTCDKWEIVIVGTISVASNKFKTVKKIMKRGGIAAIGLKASLTADPECCMDETQKDYHYEGVGLGVGLDISGSLSGDGKCFKTECISWDAHEGFGRVTSAGAGFFESYYSRLIITTPQAYLDFGGDSWHGFARGTGAGVSAETTLGKWTLGKDTSPK